MAMMDIEGEYGGAPLGDSRLAARLPKLARKLVAKPDVGFPRAFGFGERSRETHVWLRHQLSRQLRKSRRQPRIPQRRPTVLALDVHHGHRSQLLLQSN